MVGKAQKSHGARSGLYGGCSNGVTPIQFFHAEHKFNSDLVPCHFRSCPTAKRELRGKTFRSNQQSAARFGEVGGAL
jgi:hypothetical protein